LKNAQYPNDDTPATNPALPPEPVLQLRGVSKRYPGTLAVDRVDFDVRPGEVRALVGENGAGKSTLMNIIAGAFSDYTGEILVRNKPVSLHSPALARAAGIGMIHQELSLAPPLSIAENILAGRLPVRYGWLLDKKELAREASRWLLRVGLGALDPLTPVEALSQHEAQLVEIAKALSNDPSILIMDEPTSALSRREVERLFELIGELKCRDLAIVIFRITSLKFSRLPTASP
jgi:ribose transport system ATP-binding protein